MCLTNTASQICGVALSTYTTSRTKSSKPVVHFCPKIRGAILNTLLSQADECNTAHPSPFHAQDIVANNVILLGLIKHCRLQHGRSTGDYNAIIINAFKTLIKWMQRKAVHFGALTQLPSGVWARGEDCGFVSDGAAGEWFNRKQSESQAGAGKQSRPSLSSPVPEPVPQDMSLSSSRWNTSTDDALGSALSNLNLDIPAPIEQDFTALLPSLPQLQELPTLIDSAPMIETVSNLAQSVISWRDDVDEARKRDERMDKLAQARLQKFEELRVIEMEEMSLISQSRAKCVFMNDRFG
ncbi:hypothetical protein ACHAPU_010809 [Fusarium lateritium]